MVDPPFTDITERELSLLSRLADYMAIIERKQQTIVKLQQRYDAVCERVTVLQERNTASKKVLLNFPSCFKSPDGSLDGVPAMAKKALDEYRKLLVVNEERNRSDSPTTSPAC
jgi:hypothetical protein